MNKNQFMNELRQGLSSKFSKSEVENAIAYYDECLKDRIEVGEREEDIIKSFGSTKQIISKITTEIVEARSSNGDVRSAWKNFLIILAICTSPILIFTAIIVGIVLVSLTIAFVSIVIALVAATGSILLASFPIILEAIRGGIVWQDALIIIGILIGTSGALLLVVNTIYRIATWLFAKISLLFTRYVKGKV